MTNVFLHSGIKQKLLMYFHPVAAVSVIEMEQRIYAFMTNFLEVSLFF